MRRHQSTVFKVLNVTALGLRAARATVQLSGLSTLIGLLEQIDKALSDNLTCIIEVK